MMKWRGGSAFVIADPASNESLGTYSQALARPASRQGIQKQNLAGS